MAVVVGLSEEYIRACLAGDESARSGRVSVGSLRLDDRGLSGPSTTIAAAVLVPLVWRRSGWTVLLTVRSAWLKHHGGQVSFAGGRTEPDDLSPQATALREAHEEVGLVPELVDILGLLDPHPTSTGFLITPVVGLVMSPPPRWQRSPDEVETILEVPLDFILTSSTTDINTTTASPRHRHHRVHSWHWTSYYIWGATAAILGSLCDLLAVPSDESRR